MDEQQKQLKTKLDKLSAPKDAEVVLVALHHALGEKGEKEMAAQELNDLLRKFGLAFKDIHRILHEMEEETPRPVKEVKQSEDFPPNEIHYAITEEGVDRAKRLIE